MACRSLSAFSQSLCWGWRPRLQRRRSLSSIRTTRAPVRFGRRSWGTAFDSRYGHDHFQHPGIGCPHDSALNGVLPAVTDAVTIDGYTQPGANPNTLVAGDNAVLLIEMDGTNLGAGASGISVTAGPATIRGLVINRCVLGAASISLSGGTGHVVAGNFIGTDATGTVGLPNAPNGVVVSASNCAIGGADTASRNVIATHTNGIVLHGSGHTVSSNYVGVDATGGESRCPTASGSGSRATPHRPRSEASPSPPGALPGNVVLREFADRGPGGGLLVRNRDRGQRHHVERPKGCRAARHQHPYDLGESDPSGNSGSEWIETSTASRRTFRKEQQLSGVDVCYDVRRPDNCPG